MYMYKQLKIQIFIKKKLENNHHSQPHTRTLATHIHTYTQAFRSREAQMCEELESAVDRARAEGDAEVRTSVKRDLVYTKT